MTKLILIVLICLSCASIAFSQDPHTKSDTQLDVQVHHFEDTFQIEVLTIEDQSWAQELVIEHLTIHCPSDLKYGLINLKLIPSNEPCIAIVGKQHGLFTFSRGSDALQQIPNGSYHLHINGGDYGILVVEENEVFLNR